MGVSDEARYYIKEKFKIKLAKRGTPKKYFFNKIEKTKNQK
jgi:hypothetical protein